MRLAGVEDLEDTLQEWAKEGSYSELNQAKTIEWAIWDGKTYRGVQVVPYRYTRILCPTWFLIMMLSSYPTVAFMRGPMRRYWRRNRGLCVKCGYNLKGNLSGICPECGSGRLEKGCEKV